jgi:uncharacterized protein (DUF433 family)
MVVMGWNYTAFGVVPRVAKIFLDPNAPNTNAILGAVLSGGDPRKLARMLLPDDHPLKKATAWERVYMAPTGRSIVKTDGVCGGRACLDNSRMPVWNLACYWRMGTSDAQIIDTFPWITQDDLDNARAYYEANRVEIERDIADQESA